MPIILFSPDSAAAYYYVDHHIKNALTIRNSEGVKSNLTAVCNENNKSQFIAYTVAGYPGTNLACDS